MKKPRSAPARPLSLLWPAVIPALLLAAAPPAAAKASRCTKGLDLKQEEISPGITSMTESCLTPLYKAFLVKIDLTSAAFEFFTSPKAMLYKTVKAFAEDTGSVVAVNGGFYDKYYGGFFKTGGKKMGKFTDNEVSTVMAIGRGDGGKPRFTIFPPEQIVTDGSLPAWADDAVTGIPYLVDGGKAVGKFPNETIWTQRHPRTGVGFAQDQSWLIFAVVDGRRPEYSKGMTIDQWTTFFIEHDAWTALNLDGGCSSTLFIKDKGGIVNDPCKPKGEERKVHDAIGVVLKKKGTAASLWNRLIAAGLRRLLG